MIAILLTDLTHKSKEFKWDTTCEQAIEMLKTKFTCIPILQNYDPECKY